MAEHVAVTHDTHPDVTLHYRDGEPVAFQVMGGALHFVSAAEAQANLAEMIECAEAEATRVRARWADAAQLAIDTYAKYGAPRSDEEQDALRQQYAQAAEEQVTGYMTHVAGNVAAKTRQLGAHAPDVAQAAHDAIRPVNVAKNLAIAAVIEALPEEAKKPVLDSDGDPVVDLVSGRILMTIKDKHQPQWHIDGKGQVLISVPGADAAMVAALDAAVPMARVVAREELEAARDGVRAV